MSKTVFLIHGSFDRSGKSSIDLLKPYFEAAGYEVINNFDYGWTGVFLAWFRDRKIAKRLVPLVKPESVGVGHSNGCAILREASKLGAPFSQLVFLNPALSKTANVGPQVKRVHVWHSPSEKPTKIAHFIPLHPWGNMGAVGYQGKDLRFVNYNKEKDFRVISKGHSDVFEPDKLPFYGPLVVQKVTEFSV